MEKRYTVKANGTTAEGKKNWEVYDKQSEQFLSQFEGGRFALQDIAKQLNEGTMSLEPVEEKNTKTLGYMRVSTKLDKQVFDRQEEQLKAYGVDHLYADRMSGAKRERPELNKLLDDLNEGDTVVIVAIDRLSRSTKDLLEIVEIIKSKGASLKSLNDSWLDTSNGNPMSEFLLTVMGALAQMERAQITQRVREGVAVAKAKGTKLGRPKKNQHKVELALELYAKGEHNVPQIVQITGVSKATLYRKIKQLEEGTL
ncbi:recombinase family protein [Bacillus atrophaeus]|uniref:recombinase family protein n=1 Tax=Bacillus atrophaeus TaxID=1452 RepID=UPI000B929547|nr:recombinase family protein [Bacillus atrophaeus]ASS71709.1 DNA invertase Pin [Bacillus atrophaeus]KAA6454968.1 DNA invertase Pin [Bacillus atrophaeus]MDS9997151.1 recombinase family protein [Bacillus atrophaeus]MED4827705.1 recombinase family protein [Bacillus atrophaeus]PSA94148.1 DNA invertase Pin [Bacillus atrophaeus]